MDKLVPVIVFFLVIAEIILKARKTQAAARSRSLLPQPAPRPLTARRPLQPSAAEPEDDDDEAEDEESEPEDSEDEEETLRPARPPSRPAPASVAPPRVAPAWAPPTGLRNLTVASTPIQDSEPRKAIRLSSSGLRNAIILTEILGPPVALRD